MSPSCRVLIMAEYLFNKRSHKFLVDPSDMEGHLPEGSKHIKAKATEGIDIVIEEIKKL